MGGSSGWQAQEQYDKMEAVARAKKPKDRERWDVKYLKSLDKMRLKEQSDRHWSWRIVQALVMYIFLAPVAYILYEVLTFVN